MKLRGATKKKKVKEEEKEKLYRSKSNGRRRYPRGNSGRARDAPTEQFQQIYKN